MTSEETLLWDSINILDARLKRLEKFLAPQMPSIDWRKEKAEEEEQR